MKLTDPVPRFVGCDGESVGQGANHRYVLFRMGKRELYRGGRRLTTPELLGFICKHPAADTLVWFAAEYDLSMILRDVRWDRLGTNVPSPLERILDADRAWEEGYRNPYALNQWKWLFFDEERQIQPAPGTLAKVMFGVRYVPRKYLEVCRGEMVQGRINGIKIAVADPIPGTRRILCDAFDYFGSSFVSVLTDWNVGRPGQRRMIGAMKKRRERFELLTDKERAYTAAECELLAATMTKLCLMQDKAGIPRPKKWIGPGQIAARLLEKHGTITAKALKERVPKEALEMAYAGFYAARFETTRAGLIKHQVYAHDANSAFASQMPDLPCLEHGTWKKASAAELTRQTQGAIFVCPVRFSHRDDQFLCTLPVRSDEGRLSWPRKGNGVYWSDEIFSAQRRGASLTLRAGWLYEKHCDCRPLAWVNAYHKKRLRLGSQGGPIKKGLQSIYGKFAERLGSPRWANPIYAGLITARVRAKLNDLIEAVGERNVAMIASDAIYILNARAPVETGRELGQWRVKRFPSLFIVRPGLYWSAGKARKVATRGLSRKFFEPRIKAFERAWARFVARKEKLADPPSVEVLVRMFLSLRLAMRRGEPDQACQWRGMKVECNFDWHDKRVLESFDGRAMVLGSLPGSLSQFSARFDGAGGRPEFDRKFAADRGMRDLRVLTEALPDPIDLSAPFTN